MQYTIRGVSPLLDQSLRERARRSGKSLNEATVEALTEAAGLTGARHKRRLLSDISGTWRSDKALETVIAEQDRVDEDLWK